MGRYIDWKDVTGRYPEDAKKADESSIGSYWLQLAEYEIDGFLASKYTVPFTPGAGAPGIVRDLCVDLTHYKMNISQEAVEPLWKYILFRLAAINSGTMVLVSSLDSLGGVGPIWVEGEGDGTSFGPDSDLNWGISSNWMDRVEGSR